MNNTHEKGALKRGSPRRSSETTLEEAAFINSNGTSEQAEPINNTLSSKDPFLLLKSKNDSNHSNSNSNSNSSSVGPNIMAGLTVAGMAASLLASIFGLFHTDTFLSAYHLPVSVYSAGNVLYGAVNAANDVAGAWMVDYFATSRKRSDLVGLTGCLFALTFLAPFFRPWTKASHWFWDGAHFVLSLSLYDTLYSFAMILYGSIVSDDHEMTEAARVRFLSICKVINLTASFAVARLGLRLFDAQNLLPFQGFLLGLAVLAGGLSIVAQGLIVGDTSYSIRNILPVKKMEGKEVDAPLQYRNLEWRRVVKDFWNHKNFRAWIGTNMLLESANNFNRFFAKTFFDRLVVANGMDKETCDWVISMMRPLTAIFSLMAFVPIRKYGYVKVFHIMFVANGAVSLLMLCVADATSTYWIIAFLVIFPVISASIHSAVFNLAMADMVTEMKHIHASDGRYDQSSYAGLFMGANALFCKPMDAVLPIVAANAMSGDETNAQRNLFYVLTVPPLIYACLQYASWKEFNLEPDRAKTMRLELKAMLDKHHHSGAAESV